MQKETVFSSEWISIEAQHRGDDVPALNGKPFYKVLLPDGVLILPVTPDGQLVLIKQFRPAVDRCTIEIPAGGINPGELPADAACRELYEETGYRCNDYHLVGEGVVRLEREDAWNSFFVGTCAELDPNFSARENIEVMLVETSDFPDMVVRGQFDNVAALPILLMAYWKLGLNLIAPSIHVERVRKKELL